MALATYTDLKAAIADWAHRSNVSTSTIDTFIDLAESEFNNRLRCVEQETVAALACTTKYTDLPSDFLEMRVVEYDGSILKNVAYATPEYMAWLRATYTSGDPVAYSIRGTSLELVPEVGSDDPTVDGFGSDVSPFETGEVEVILTYYAKITALSDSNTTNWLLTSHPNMYLYECLRQMSIYTKDDASVARYATLMQGYYSGLQASDNGKRFGGPLVMRVG